MGKHKRVSALAVWLADRTDEWARRLNHDPTADALARASDDEPGAVVLPFGEKELRNAAKRRHPSMYGRHLLARHADSRGARSPTPI